MIIISFKMKRIMFRNHAMGVNDRQIGGGGESKSMPFLVGIKGEVIQGTNLSISCFSKIQV
jgi:hypothetical protein